MAVLNMKVEPNTPISRSLGFNPRGVIVDNVTQYWLFFPQTEQYCPPFTVGWSAPIILNPAGYGYMELKTPFGESNQTNITPNVGHFVSLVWTDSDVAFSPGQPAGTGSSVDPSLTPGTSSVSPIIYDDEDVLVPALSAVVGAIHIPTVGKRYRILKVQASYGFLALNPGETRLSLRIWEGNGVIGIRIIGNLYIHPYHPVDKLDYGEGIVLNVNRSFFFSCAPATWKNEGLLIDWAYQEID